MRLLLVGTLAFVTACGSERAPKEAAQSVEDAPVSGPRFLVVSIRRIEILDRHPEDGDVLPKRDTTPNGATFDVRYAEPDYGARPPDRRPEMHTYEVKLAVPEHEPTTFTRTLDDARGYRWMMLARGWEIEGDGTARLLAYETANAQMSSATGPTVGPYRSSSSS
jgi:hypothetical protein